MFGRKLFFTPILIGLVTSSCSVPSEPERPTSPILGKLQYRVGITLEEQPVTHVRIGSISGERCYNDSNSTYQTHQFVFDDQRDFVEINITDINGVAPGKRYQHVLYFKRNSGQVKAGAYFTIDLVNPFTATEPKHEFQFRLQTDTGTSGLTIPLGTVLGGVYELSETGRDLAIDLTFNLDTDISYTNVCAQYD